MRNKIAKFIQESVEWLQKEQCGCCCHKLDDRLAIFVGWSAGYGNMVRGDVVQTKDDLDFGINVGLKVWTSDDMWTDFDWLNFPYYYDGDVLDMSCNVAPRADYPHFQWIAHYMLQCYDEIKNLELAKDGMILGKKEMFV